MSDASKPSTNGALFGLEESILAQSNRQAEQLKHVMRGGSPRTFDVMNRQWIASEDGKLYHYSYFDPRLDLLSGLSIYEFDDLGWRLKSSGEPRAAAYDLRLDRQDAYRRISAAGPSASRPHVASAKAVRAHSGHGRANANHSADFGTCGHARLSKHPR